MGRLLRKGIPDRLSWPPNLQMLLSMIARLPPMRIVAPTLCPVTRGILLTEAPMKLETLLPPMPTVRKIWWLRATAGAIPSLSRVLPNRMPGTGIRPLFRRGVTAMQLILLFRWTTVLCRPVATMCGSEMMLLCFLERRVESLRLSRQLRLRIVSVKALVGSAMGRPMPSCRLSEGMTTLVLEGLGIATGVPGEPCVKWPVSVLPSTLLAVWRPFLADMMPLPELLWVVSMLKCVLSLCLKCLLVTMTCDLTRIRLIGWLSRVMRPWTLLTPVGTLSIRRAPAWMLKSMSFCGERKLSRRRRAAFMSLSLCSVVAASRAVTRLVPLQPTGTNLEMSGAWLLTVTWVLLTVRLWVVTLVAGVI